MPRVALAGLVAELDIDDPAASSRVTETLREFLTPAAPTFRLQIDGGFLEGAIADGASGAADFVARDGTLLMTSRAGTARFDYTRHHGTLTVPATVDVVSGLLVAIALDYLAARGALVLHAAGVRVETGALVFFGPSGSGKSTLAARLAADERAEIISDEAVAVRPDRAGWVAEGLPWRGRATAAPLRGLFHLGQGARLAVEPLDPGGFVRSVASSIYVAGTAAWRSGRLLDIAGALARAVPCFRLSCPRTGEVLPHVLARLSASPPGGRVA